MSRLCFRFKAFGGGGGVINRRGFLGRVRENKVSISQIIVYMQRRSKNYFLDRNKYKNSFLQTPHILLNQYVRESSACVREVI